MIKKNKVKIAYVTHADLAEQTQIILGAIDGRFNGVDTRFDKMDERLDKVDERIDTLATRVDIRFNNVDARFDELETELKSDINNVQTLIDGYVKAQEDFKQEFVIMKEEIRQIKQVFKQKLGVEIRAF
jgi:archaellum component FlaC